MNIRPDSLSDSSISRSQTTTETQVQLPASSGGAATNSSGDVVELSGFPSRLHQNSSTTQSTDSSRIAELTRLARGPQYAVDAVQLGKKIVSDSLVNSTPSRG
jgi:anti-sigma28 factor (negative regulator of flagellin synthesis)